MKKSHKRDLKYNCKKTKLNYFPLTIDKECFMNSFALGET